MEDSKEWLNLNTQHLSPWFQSPMRLPENLLHGMVWIAAAIQSIDQTLVQYSIKRMWWKILVKPATVCDNEVNVLNPHEACPLFALTNGNWR
ncbi:hypothetical protein GUITHDRAFT_154253 [Guillardia theta CCMP2712]|uniref:Uncharacterized protein n=1 Tax=Guillardia theta (strain CCMP2712) TaxID=905079 RepID=L1IVJ2_GUITC|nr:hypothetical protein GUITHDRAFT_154253 [Guillardia theta CCMP2712]EKX40132.1 hypothetical protein GUITHDRAFT_154253 [Guillardia theta CCMP2712]|eukprot:XP_005827112.1 hypothetical protein GUITHDRAFT_154253 [Guillardia theta CCMP2712]